MELTFSNNAEEQTFGGNMKTIVALSATYITLFTLIFLPMRLVAQAPTRYKLADVGTFGNPNITNSHPAVSPFFEGISAQSLSSGGELAGFAETDTLDAFAPACFQEDCLVAHAFRRQNGALTDLGSLDGPGYSSLAFWISGNGLIAGMSQNGKINPAIPDLPELRAMLSVDGNIADLGVLPGGRYSGAFAVNNRGRVVGFSTNATSDPNPSLLTETIGDPEMRAVLWQNGQIQDLTTLAGGTDSVALLVNEHGQVVGQSYTADSNSPTPFCNQAIRNLRGFIWENGTIRDIGTLGGSCAFTYALNNRGQIVGQSSVGEDVASHPYIWDPQRGITDLFNKGTLGGTYGYAQWINDPGTVVGTVGNEGDQALLAVSWTPDGIIHNLGTLDGDPCSATDAINSDGQIVGGSGFFAAPFFPACTTTVEHAFLWDRGTMLDLNGFVPPDTDLTLNEATFINDRREISGFGTDSNDNQRAFLLIPCGAGTDGCIEVPTNAAYARVTRAHDSGPRENSPRAMGRRLIPRFQGVTQNSK
jgi:probable HAF family extracellular repeat protein